MCVALALVACGGPENKRPPVPPLPADIAGGSYEAFEAALVDYKVTWLAERTTANAVLSISEDWFERKLWTVVSLSGERPDSSHHR